MLLRRGACLVIRAKGKDFAVGVDDAERGAALLNSLAGARAEQPWTRLLSPTAPPARRP
ncbi:hypothetical protein ACGFNX_29425 [Streptomyces sp. NPDC048723]|uniref:hypothetical protein n=1 Tax=unclassified Streptomyces TaxID=2593676 RepID=UPI003567A844